MKPNELSKNALLIFLYWIGVGLFLFLIQIVTGERFFGESNFLNYDAAHYHHISVNGYQDFRVVFFPLFPKIWGILKFSAIGISLLNGLIYIISLIMLTRLFEFSRFQVMLALVIPSNIFFFLPYSESIFFAISVILIVGLAKNRLWMILAGLFLASFSRPAYVVFLPAILMIEFVSVRSLSEKLKRSLYFIIAILAGTFLVAIVQYQDSGQWFTFFSEQKLWGNYLQMPTFPIRSWSGAFITRVDGTVLFIGLVCIVFVCNYFFRYVRQKKSEKLAPEVLFSMLYIAGITLSVILFRGGSLFSLNRFVLCTPFFLLLLKYLHERVEIKRTVFFYGSALVVLTLFWLLFYSFVHIQSFLKFFGATVLILMIVRLISQQKSITNFYRLLVFFILIELQVYLMIRFLTGQWVA